MAEAVVTFLLENLLQIIKENVNLIGSAKEQFELLVEEVKGLKAILQDAAKHQSNSKQLKNFVKEVQVTVYRAEDLIDKFLVQAKLHQDKGFLKKPFDSNHTRTVKELAININAVLDKVKRIRKDNQQFFQTTSMLDDQPKIVSQGSQDTLWEENEVVGFNEEAKTVIKRLAEGTKVLDVIPVVGMPGLGKTTLAIKIYKDPQISFEFFNRIWVYVGLQYKLKEVFLSILKGFTKHIENYQEMGVNELPKIIREFISKGTKCLLVLDDVWDTEVVHSVKKVFPENYKGHRIMITTRDGRVAKFANDNPHELKFLKDEESFQLLENRVFGSNNRRCPEEVVADGKSIAKQCSGVPLAVVVIAGALRGRTSQGEWKMVKDNVGKHLISKDDPQSCLKFVKMSYCNLPEEMKACFLYCGAFPQGFEIPSWKLIRLWISEGLINSNLNASPEDIAEYYLNDLVNRNLVIIMEKRADGQVKTCRLHDMLHEFCKMEAQNEGLFQEVCEKNDQAGLTIPDPDTCRRLCIQPSLLNSFISPGKSVEHVRSFLCFSRKQKGSEQLSNIRLLPKAFPLVRVLDVEPLNFNFSRDFGVLFHLRYVAISGDYHALPMSIGKFWNLQTLILNTKASTIEIKAEIWNMLRLRHLHTNVPAKLPAPATQTGEPSCLQTLSIVAPGSCRKDVLARACNLRKVSVQGQLSDFFETNKGGFSNFEKLKCLEHLKLLNGISTCTSKFLQLPPAFFAFLRKLKKLTLSNTRFDWSEANRLGQLECLEVLKLKEHAFRGTTWDSDFGSFNQLKLLWIERADLKCWKASYHQFQILKYLVLKSCNALEVVPIELANVRTLHEMTLENTNKAIKSAKAIQCKKKEMHQERMQKVAESKSGTESQALESFKFKLTIFPLETADCSATQ